MAIQTPPLVMLRSIGTLPPAATRPWVMMRSCLMAPSQTASHLVGTTLLLAPMRSLVTLTDTATTLLAPTHFSSMLTALQTPPLVITRSGIMTRMQLVWPTTTRQLALWRSSVTLMVVRTQPWVQGQDKTWSRASITLTSATSLVPSPPT